MYWSEASEAAVRRFGALLTPLVVSAALSHFVLVLGIHYWVSTAVHLALLCGMTAVFFAAFHLALLPHLLPKIWSLPVRLQIILPSVSFALGCIVMLRMPLDLGDHALLGTSWLAQVLNYGAAGIVAGSVLLLAALALIGRDRPLNRLVLIVPVLFGIYLLVGVSVFQGYGVSTDEHIQRTHGLVAARYILSGMFGANVPATLEQVEWLPDYLYRHYGVAQHLPVVSLELANQLQDPQTIWLLRHYLTFLFFFASAIFMFQLGRDAVGHWGYGLCAAVLYVSYPRIFAETFYNIKDTTFLAAFAIALYFAYRYLSTRQLRAAVLFGATLAFATNIRLLGAGLGLLVVFILILDLVAERHRFWPANWKPLCAGVAAFFLVFLAITPVLWANPLSAAIDIVKFTLRGSGAWSSEIIYWGEWINGNNLPWHYLPVWLLISSPWPVLLLFLVGALATLGRMVAVRFNLLALRHDAPLFFLALAVAPVLATVVLSGQLHSGWRHFFFIYAPIVLVACFGLRRIVDTLRRSSNAVVRPGGVAVLAALAVLQLDTIHWSVVNHPHQQVYFNALAQQVFGGREGFQRDYWRMGVKQALEHILARDDRDGITVMVAGENVIRDAAVTKQLDIFDPASRARITPVVAADGVRPDYVIEIYRYAPWEVPDDFGMFHEIAIDGLPVVTTYARRGAAPGQGGD